MVMKKCGTACGRLWHDIATKSDLAVFRSDIERDFSQFRTEMRAEMKAEIAELKADIHSSLRSQLVQTATIFGILNTAMLVAVRLLR